MQGSCPTISKGCAVTQGHVTCPMLPSFASFDLLNSFKAKKPSKMSSKSRSGGIFAFRTIIITTVLALIPKYFKTTTQVAEGL